jgi:hypothetical protein
MRALGTECCADVGINIVSFCFIESIHIVRVCIYDVRTTASFSLSLRLLCIHVAACLYVVVRSCSSAF